MPNNSPGWNDATCVTARQALFAGQFEHVLTLCDALAEGESHTVEADLLRCRAYIALGQAERALAIVRELHAPYRDVDTSLTVRMLEGAALARLSRVDAAIDVLSSAHEEAQHAHPTVRAEIAVHLGAALYRRGRYDRAMALLEAIPSSTDILRARATVFEAWIAVERGDFQHAIELFRQALREINDARHYDRFVESTAIYGLAYTCAESGRLEVWPELRGRAQRFDWSVRGVALPQFHLAIASSYLTEMRGDFDDAERWASRAQAVAPGPAQEIIALTRLAALTGRYGESRAHSHFVHTALRIYDAVGPDALTRDDLGVLLSLAEELVQGRNPADALALLTFHREAMASRIERTKEHAPLAAAEQLVHAFLDDAQGRTARAYARYEDAFQRYDRMGYRRRAAICAYRMSLHRPDGAHRSYLAEFVAPLHAGHWLRERIAVHGVRDIRLSDRQTAILRLVAEGKSNKEIASQRGGSWYTARNVVRELIALFGVRTRSDLVRVATARGLLAAEQDDAAS